MKPSVTKAVIPAAGLGTRFLPATKAQPKEMLPVVDKPAIQYVVEEAVRAGLRDVLPGLTLKETRDAVQAGYRALETFGADLREVPGDSAVLLSLDADTAKIGTTTRPCIAAGRLPPA